MISVSIEDNGFLQRLTALVVRAGEIQQSVFEDIGTILINSIHNNFKVSGRPSTWTPSKKIATRGGQTLIESGALMNSAEVSSVSADHVEVSIGGDLPYAAIHQFGGVINHPGSDKLQVFDIGGKTVFSKGTKPHQITIPARKYFRIQDEDKDSIMNLLHDFILNGENPSISIE